MRPWIANAHRAPVLRPSPRGSDCRDTETGRAGSARTHASRAGCVASLAIVCLATGCGARPASGSNPGTFDANESADGVETPRPDEGTAVSQPDASRSDARAADATPDAHPPDGPSPDGPSPDGTSPDGPSCLSDCPLPDPAPSSVSCTALSGPVVVDSYGNWPTLAWNGSSWGLCYEREGPGQELELELWFAVVDLDGSPVVGPMVLPPEPTFAQGCDIAWNAGVYATIAVDHVVRILDESGALVATTSPGFDAGYYSRIAPWGEGFVVVDTSGGYPPAGSVLASAIAPDGTVGDTWTVSTVGLYDETRSLAVSPCGLAFGGYHPSSDGFDGAVGVKPTCAGSTTTDLPGIVGHVLWAGDRYLAFASELERFDLDGSLASSTPYDDDGDWWPIAAAYTGSFVVALEWSWDVDPTGAMRVRALDLDGAPLSDAADLGVGYGLGFSPAATFNGEDVGAVWGGGGGLHFARLHCE